MVGDLGKFDRVANVESFLLDEENKVAVCCNVDTDDEARTRIFVVGEDMYKQVYKGIKKPKYFHYRQPLLLTYVPSLVCIHKKKSTRRKKIWLSFTRITYFFLLVLVMYVILY